MASTGMTAYEPTDNVPSEGALLILPIEVGAVPLLIATQCTDILDKSCAIVRAAIRLMTIVVEVRVIFVAERPKTIGRVETRVGDEVGAEDDVGLDVGTGNEKMR